MTVQLVSEQAFFISKACDFLCLCAFIGNMWEMIRSFCDTAAVRAVGR